MKNIYLFHKSCLAGYNSSKEIPEDIDLKSTKYNENLVFLNFKNGNSVS